MRTEISYFKRSFIFKKPVGTSRGTLRSKDSWFLGVKRGEHLFLGECGLLKSLSCDPLEGYEEKLKWICQNFHKPTEILLESLTKFPSIRFGLEQLKIILRNGHPRLLFPSKFTEGKDDILINGLIWMGCFEDMNRQIREKIKEKFSCIKLKIGALDFEREYEFLAHLRSQFSKEHLEIRVDANGAFKPNEALEKLERLADLGLHSIEQPIRAGQTQEMARLCEQSPLPIALDEELIGIESIDKRQQLLETIKPSYIILKPSLIGGYKSSQDWINISTSQNIGWWITSALESNVGLNAIAQWTYTLQNPLPQGLGTGALYSNNLPSSLTLRGEKMIYKNSL